MAPPFAARLTPTGTTTPNPNPDPNLPTTQDLLGTWHMAASSSPFWHDAKHSISVTYSTPDTNKSGIQPGTLEDVTTYFSTNSSKPTSTRGVNTPSATEPGMYEWRGAGWLLRMITSRWEVVGWGVLPEPEQGQGQGQEQHDVDVDEGYGEGDDREPVLVTLAGKTVFSPQSLSIYTRRKETLPEGRIREVAEAVVALGDENLKGEAGRLRALPLE